ncbi:hypothetical protein GGX14DRAFT_409297 [Mycena pura]|uniref:Uncharacterized protein n=1 Tax=Mycena pura TaxID=153505 RepID=A0AAD6UJF1_9AGAR|nr:hypothetical protein GGX14DRAFT_409297 [Mycena pura]
MASMGTGLAVPVPHRRFPTSSPVRVWYGQVFIGVHIPMSMTPCLSSLNNPPRWSLPTTPDTAGHLKVEMMECTPRSRCRGMHPVHKGQQKGGMREQHSLFPHVKIVSKPLSQDTTQKCREVSGHQRSLHLRALSITSLGRPHKGCRGWAADGPWYDIALRRNGYYLILSSLDIAEKGLKELIKAALEEDSDDDNKPEWQRRRATKSGPSMRQGSSGGAGRRQARVSDHGRCTGQRRRRASKPTPRMLPRAAGAAQGSPVLQRGSVVAARRRQQASKASVYADALPSAATGETSGGGAAQVLQRGSAVAARRRERVSKARARCPVSMRRRRVARRCNAAAAAGDSTAGGVVRQLTPRTLPQARCTGNGRRKRAPAVPRCSRGPPRAALPRQNILSDRHKHEFFAERSLSCGLYPKYKKFRNGESNPGLPRTRIKQERGMKGGNVTPTPFQRYNKNFEGQVWCVALVNNVGWGLVRVMEGTPPFFVESWLTTRVSVGVDSRTEFKLPYCRELISFDRLSSSTHQVSPP